MAVHELYPYLCVINTEQAIEFYTRAFGAREKFRMTKPSGRIGHAELGFNGTTPMLSDEFSEYEIKGPPTIGGTPVTIHLHVDNANKIISGAVKLGAKLEMEPQDQFYSER